ncbi:MBL fold metallo-hydrolase [Marinagarivorans algicola]|uniref:MBL fold metallo-hydrolase n=1 Tax=Marinagarivorans algicola TaxID=1513270 RepID=UPI0006B55F9B|nr:MBL fold metallo-hydrolase [Marinagarivorans algicola]
MRVQHLQSATQIIELGDVKLLTDPWLTEGEYYGSWFHYPPFGDAQIDALEYDYIYVSHVHPDHLSEKTFEKLPYKKPVLIHNYDAKFVKRKLEMWGFEVIECNHGQTYNLSDDACITIYAADNCNPELCGKFMGCGALEKKMGSTQIDTLAVFECDGEVILNTNDCPYALAVDTITAHRIHQKNIDLLLVGYGGAGPYPQCFEFDSIDLKTAAIKKKEQQFLDQAVNYIKLVKPFAYAPFAGTYILGSRLSDLTDYRGVPSLLEAGEAINQALAVDPPMIKPPVKPVGILLEQLDIYDVSQRKLIKNTIFGAMSYSDYVKKISSYPLDFDKDDWDDKDLELLIKKAAQRFHNKAKDIGLVSNTRLVIQTEKIAFELGTRDDVVYVALDKVLCEPFIKVIVEHNLLHRLLRGPRYAHWNNAEIGSHLKYIRKPDQFERGLYYCMCFLHQ